jgi:MFS family permease
MPIESGTVAVVPANTALGKRLTAVLIANALLRVASSAGGALIGFYLASLARKGAHIDATLIGTLGAVVNGSEFLFAVPAGLLADRYPVRYLLAGCALLGGVATQLFGLSHLIAIFFVSRLLEGIAAAGSTSPLLAHLANVSRERGALRGRMMGFYELSLLCGLALGGLIGGTLWEGMQTAAFRVLAGLYLLAGILFLWGVREQKPLVPALDPLAGLQRALADLLLRQLALPWIAMTMMVGMWLTHISFLLSGPKVSGQYLVGRFSPHEVGFVLLGYALVFAAGVTVWGFLMARFARQQVLMVTLTAMLFASLSLFLLNHSGAVSAATRELLLGLAAVSILVESGFTPAMLAFLADVADTGAARGATMGIYSLLLGLGSALGAFAGGWLSRWRAFDGLLVGTVALTLGALFLLARIYKRQSTLFRQ